MHYLVSGAYPLDLVNSCLISMVRNSVLIILYGVEHAASHLIELPILTD